MMAINPNSIFDFFMHLKYLPAVCTVLLIFGPCIQCSPNLPDKPEISQQESVASMRQSAQLGQIPPARLVGFPPGSEAKLGEGNGSDRAEFEFPISQIAGWKAPFESEPETGWSAQAYHGKALTQLLLDTREESLRAAVENFEAAVAESPDNAAYWNDLGVATFALGKKLGDGAALPKAFGQFEKAKAASPENASAEFNSALVLEEFGLIQQAKAALERALTLEANPKWAREIQARLDVLVESEEMKVAAEVHPDWRELSTDAGALKTAVSQFRTQAWRWLERDWLPAWGRGDTADLPLSQAVAGHLAELSGDHLYLDSLTALLQASHDQREALAEGHRLFFTGVTALEEENLEAAERDLTRSVAKLTEGGSPFQYRAGYYLALLRNLQGNVQEAHGALAQLVSLCEAKSYRNLQGEALWVKGQAEVAMALPDQALATYREALPVFQRLGGVDNLCGIHYKIASSLLYLGETSQGWVHLQQALGMLGQVSKPMRAYQVNMLATDGALRVGQIELAAHFQSDAQRYAQQTGSDWAKATAALWGARTASLLNRKQEAEAYLQEATAIAEIFPSESLRNQIQADCLATWGELTQNPQALKDALSRLEERNNLVNKASLLCSLAKAYRFENRPEDAIEALETSLAIYENYRQGLSDILRTRLFNNVAAIFEEMISLQLSLGQVEKAFNFQEAKRARSLLEQSMSAGEADSAYQKPKQLREVQAALDDEGLLVFSATNQTLTAWLVTANQVECKTITLEIESLETALARFRQKLIRRALLAPISLDSKELYQKLIAPFEPVITGLQHLVIIPEGPLHSLPFAALLDPQQRYLGERLTLSVAASASTYLQSRKQSERSAQESSLENSPEVLVVGSPAFDTRMFPSFAQLSMQEAESLGQLYGPRARVLLGSAATKSELTNALPHAQVLHFNGHARVNSVVWQRSFLVLAAGEDPQANRLDASEIQALPLSELRLAILSACSTGLGSPHASEGVANLARPFLAAGVPAVVASLWDVEDVTTSEWMVHFHRELRKGATPQQAIRRITQASLASKDAYVAHPASWAAFQVYGLGAPVFFESF